jgi:hypothetical protein
MLSTILRKGIDNPFCRVLDEWGRMDANKGTLDEAVIRHFFWVATRSHIFRYGMSIVSSKQIVGSRCEAKNPESHVTKRSPPSAAKVLPHKAGARTISALLRQSGPSGVRPPRLPRCNIWVPARDNGRHGKAWDSTPASSQSAHCWVQRLHGCKRERGHSPRAVTCRFSAIGT